MDNFVAIDFETANFVQSSVCSVGIVIVKDGEVTFNLNEQNDVNYLEGKRDLLESITTDLLKNKYKLVFKFAPNKQKEEDFFSTLAQIVGAEKITKK